MSTHAYSNHAEVIEENIVESVCSDELENLKQVLDKYDISLEQLSTATRFGDDWIGEIELILGEEEQAQEVADIYQALINKFQEKTGLTLYLNYHEADGRGDEVDGHFWCVDGVYTISPAAEKLIQQFKTDENPYPIETKSWITYG